MWQCLQTQDKAKLDCVSMGRFYKLTKVNTIPVHLCPEYLTKGVGDHHHDDGTFPIMLNQRS